MKGYFLGVWPPTWSDYKNKALQATVSYFKNTNNTVYRSNTINWVLMAITMHTDSATMRYLRGQFPDRIMSKRGDWAWPPGPPDLTVCNFFLWGYLKHQIWNVSILSNSRAICKSFEKQLHIIAFNILEERPTLGPDVAAIICEINLAILRDIRKNPDRVS